MNATHTKLGDDLRLASRLHAEFATKAATIPDVDARDRAAAQLRFVAALADTGTPAHVAQGQAWLTASKAMVAAYAAQDAAWLATANPMPVIASAGLL